MSEVENNLKAAKKELKPYDILSIICLVVFLVAVVFLILGTVIKNNVTMDILFAVGVGIAATCIVFVVSIVIVARNKYNEYYRLKKELKQSKK